MAPAVQAQVVQAQVQAERVRVAAVQVAAVPAARLEPRVPASAAQLAEAEPVTAVRVVLAAVQVGPEEDTHLTRG